LLPVNSVKVRFNPPIQRKRRPVIEAANDEVCEVNYKLLNTVQRVPEILFAIDYHSRRRFANFRLFHSE